MSDNSKVDTTGKIDTEYSLEAVPKAAPQRRGFWAMFVVMLGFTFFSASMSVGAQMGIGLDLSGFVWAVIIGGIIAQSVFDFFHKEESQKTVDDLKSLGLFSHAPTVKVKTKTKTLFDEDDRISDGIAAHAQPLEGMTIVVTSSLGNEIESVIEEHGGRASSSVSSKTTFVLVGAEPGSKLAKAEKIGVRVVDETEFMKMIGK